MAELKVTLQGIKARYEKHRDYKVVPISGAYGSINPQGMIVCDFYFEKLSSPDEITVTFDEDTHKPKESKPENFSPTLVREFLLGVAMPPEVARGLAEWLMTKYKEYSEIMEKENESPAKHKI